MFNHSLTCPISMFSVTDLPDDPEGPRKLGVESVAHPSSS